MCLYLSGRPKLPGKNAQKITDLLGTKIAVGCLKWQESRLKIAKIFLGGERGGMAPCPRPRRGGGGEWGGMAPCPLPPKGCVKPPTSQKARSAPICIVMSPVSEEHNIWIPLVLWPMQPKSQFNTMVSNYSDQIVTKAQCEPGLNFTIPYSKSVN